MPSLEYVGRSPDNQGSLVTKSYADTQQANTLATTAFIDSSCTNVAGTNGLVTPLYVDNQVANYATQAYAQIYTATNYVPALSLGSTNIDNSDGTATGAIADNGDGTVTAPVAITDPLNGTAVGNPDTILTIAKSDSGGNIPSAIIPSGYPVTDRVLICYDLASSGATNYIGTSSRSPTGSSFFTVAQIVVPDPGYVWVPLAFAMISGNANGTPSVNRFTGNGNYGLITVNPNGDTTTTYSSGVCTGDSKIRYYPCLPHAAPPGIAGQMTPTTQPPISGGKTLNLNVWAWGQGSTGYTFYGTGLVFYVLVSPAA